MTKNYILQNSLYKNPKDGGAKAPSAPPVPPPVVYVCIYNLPIYSPVLDFFRIIPIWKNYGKMPVQECTIYVSRL